MGPGEIKPYIFRGEYAIPEICPWLDNKMGLGKSRPSSSKETGLKSVVEDLALVLSTFIIIGYCISCDETII